MVRHFPKDVVIINKEINTNVSRKRKHIASDEGYC